MTADKMSARAARPREQRDLQGITGQALTFSEQGPLGAEWLVRARGELPLVVCGDLNSSPLSGAYRKLARDLRDVRRCNLRPRATWPSRPPFWRIDHLFVSEDVSVRSAGVVDSALARAASDHLPLLAELGL